MLKKLFTITLIAILVLPKVSSGDIPHRGVWVTVFAASDILKTKKATNELITTCKKIGVNEIYLQVFRSGKAYYNSSITDRTPYNEISKNLRYDPIDYLLNRAKNNGIEVFAWVNTLSLAQNENAHIIRKLGVQAVTLDQHERTSYVKKGKEDNLDNYYIREGQLFLEPGNQKVRNYMISVINEIVRKYPAFSGVHLDYIRYPIAVPFSPGSRFDPHGISYGYTYRNMLNFKNKTKLNPLKMDKKRENCRMWDDWRRDQVTILVKSISEDLDKISPALKLSCAVIPSPERAYTVYLQAWPEWLDKNYVDYVVTMNYTEDVKLMNIRTRECMLSGIEDKVYTGVGAYLLKGTPEIFAQELKALEKLSPKGIVIFSYDDIAVSKEMRKAVKAL